ncbi:hypothetical protein NEUTE1DRAFT_124568 [Neurospora tetrasperma FGSC 2508]|uniref:Uncharacterized protein n=1 Tax=Neurospora tetrasperma (strain FGSC 2508 / ATCC MYA-4615 / P0657) TaxID=510951 RepID=F8MX19_NEUT8|nr:uncharacterized protein NEUTE1DRAFT_124568 [Neurospora tetrasperma FGSC 2508]EGO54290.1 hypothetical protein NEUTE1DRAFT_124568 [Neurospora tetrasperma FGSC 2508]
MTPKPKAKPSSYPKTKAKIKDPRTLQATMKKTPTPKRKAIRHHACRLNPPCKQGHGGPAKTILPIGKYFFSEEALEHDLGALKKGAVYKGDKEFYKRVKAWYKAEVDRCMHRKLVESEAEKEKEKKELKKLMIRPMAVTRPVTTKRTLAAAADSDDIDLSDDRSTSQSDESPSESDYSDFEDEHLRKVIALRASTPIRQNPQKLQTPSPSPNKLTPTRVQPSRAAKRKAEPPLLPLTPIQTPSPKRQKVTLNIKRPNPLPKAGHPGKEPAEETKGDYSLSKLDLDEFQPSYADRGELADRLDVASFMISVEKAVETAVSELVAARLGNGDDEEVFEPAGDAVPGENWRPPALSRSALATIELGVVGGKKKGVKKGLELRLASREGTPAPEAEMKLSPTLGRWQLADRRGSGFSGLAGPGRPRTEQLVKLELKVDLKAVVVDKECGPASENRDAVAKTPVEESNKRSVQCSSGHFQVLSFSLLFAVFAGTDKEHCKSEGQRKGEGYRIGGTCNHGNG